VVESDPVAARAKIARLNGKGLKAQAAYHERLKAVEERWQTLFSKATVLGLRDSLEPLVKEGTTSQSPLFRGLEPRPEGWRAEVPRPETLPHFPMVLHRGGYPDGS